MRDRFYMQMALDQAAKGLGYVSPNPLVGAVVVREGRVVGRGYHARYGEAHAEVNALAEAGEAAQGGTLYVTLEPCNHTGKTPPCTEAIINAGIRRVITAMEDPNPLVAGGGHARLQKAGLTVASGVGRSEAERLNEAFVKWIRTRRPFVILKCAATLDGRLATRTGDAKWVTGPEARAYVHRLRHAVDGILVGVNTIKTDDPRLTTRLPEGPGVDPRRIILDTRLRLPLTARVLHLQSAAETLVVAGPEADPAARDAVAATGARIITAPLHQGRIDLTWLMEHLGAMGLASLLIEGGGQVAGAALRSGIVDKLCLFYAPKLLGGDDGIPMCAGPGAVLMRDSLPVKSVRIQRLAEDLLVEGYLSDPAGPD
jgi:diaminohydroxyphosphoribosylaminopyrimidine deaminase/5-amino-6-(5-phosphoribosylamino)uracil reductase